MKLQDIKFVSFPNFQVDGEVKKSSLFLERYSMWLEQCLELIQYISQKSPSTDFTN